jgi:hypothetical protein
MADFTFTVYREDGSELFQVGTAADHPAPYLHLPGEYDAGEIDLLNGRALLGQIGARVIDPALGADHTDRFLTRLLGIPAGQPGAGHSAVNGRRATFRRVGPDGARLLLEGSVGGVELSESRAGFRFTLLDSRAGELKAKAFQLAGTSTVWPRGVLDGYGRLPGGGWLAPPTRPASGTVRTTGIANWRIVKVDRARVLKHDLILTDAMRESVRPAWSAERSRWEVPGVVVRWRVVGGQWETIPHMEVSDPAYRSGIRGVSLFDTDPSEIKDHDGRAVPADLIDFVHLRADAGEPLPEAGDRVEIILLHAGAPSEAYPFHWEGTAGELLHGLHTGAFGGPAVPVDAARFIGADALPVMRTPLRLRITKAVDDRKAFAERIYKALLAAPALDAEGRISPVVGSLPGVDAELPQVDDTNAKPIAGWSHPLAGAVTVVSVKYGRDYLIPAEQDPTGARSGGDGIATQEVEVRRPAPPDLLDLLGERVHEVGGTDFFRALGGAEGRPVTGDVLDEAGAQRAIALGYEILDRWVFGGQTSFCQVAAADFPGLREGSWILDARSWRPVYRHGRRGSAATLAQVAAVRAVSDTQLGLRLIDAGPADQPLDPPQLGAATVGEDGVLSAAVDAVVAGAEAAVEYALSPALPGQHSGLWTFLGRLGAPGVLRSAPLPAGVTAWVRARSVALGRRRSAWVVAALFAVPAVPRLTSFGVELEDGGVRFSWTSNGFTGAVRVHYVVRIAGSSAPLAASVDAPAGPGTVSLAVAVPAGAEIAAEGEPWTWWSGAAVTGEAGLRIPASAARPADDSAYAILQARVVEDRDTEVVVEVRTGPLVDELQIFVQLVPTPYIGRTDPKVTGTARPGAVVVDTRARVTLPKPSGRYLLLVSVVALDADLRERGSRELSIPAAEVRLGERVAAAVVGDAADVTVSLDRPSLSAFPVECGVYLEDTDGVPLVRHTFTADGPRAIGPADYPELGAIPLPERRPLDVIAAFEAVDGSLRFARASPNRDPLPWGAPSADDYRPDARIVLPYDPDTDAIYVRLGDGRVRTYTALVGGGSWVYIRGTTTLDDGSVEDTLRPGETSTPYVVEYEGGGARLEYFRAPLHGVAPQAPSARGYFDLVANRTAAAAGADLASPVGEDVGLRVRFAADADAPIYTLVSADNTPLYLPSGSRVTPAALYDDGPGAPLAKLAAVALRSGQIVHLEIQAYGRDSGVSGPWTPLPLSLMERARGGSLEGTYDPATGHITAEAIGGTHQQSALVLVADNEAMVGAMTQVLALTEGAVQRPVFAVPAAKRQGTWHLRMICNNGPVIAGAPSGLDGDALTARVVLPDPIPTVRKVPSQSGSTGLLSLEITDLSGRRGAVRFKTHAGGGDVSFADPGDGSWSDDPTAPYAASVSIDPKHGAWIAGAIAYTAHDGAQRWLIETHHFDPDQWARVENLMATFDASHQVLPSAGGDEDTDVVYFTVGVGAEPADPTPSAHNGFVVGRSGSVNTGVVCGPGSTAVVKARGWNSVTGIAPAEMVKRIEERNGATVATPAPPFVTSARATATAGNTLCGSIVHTIYLSVSDTAAAGYGVVVEEWRTDVEDWQAVHVGILPLTTTQVAHNVAGYRITLSPDYTSRRAWTYRVRVVRTSDGGTASPPQACAPVEQLVAACS